MNNYQNLSWAFLKIGLFGFGGGYAMLPLIRQEVVEVNNWTTVTEFTDIVAISQVTPGPIAINAATYLGYTATSSIFGAIIATICVCIPPVIIMSIVCYYFRMMKDNARVKNALKLLRPAVVGLVAAAAISLMNKNNFEDWKSIAFFIPTMWLSIKNKMHPIVIIIIAGILGCLVY